jgi:hypothetical protein
MCLLRNHSLKPKLRQRGEQLLALTNDVIRLPEVRRLFQRALPFTQRLIPKILSIQHQQIEREVENKAFLPVCRSSKQGRSFWSKPTISPSRMADRTLTA